MKEEIAQFNKQNGNVTYTIKELIQGLHTKLDKTNETMLILNTKFDEQPLKCSKQFLSQRVFYTGFWLLFILISALAGYAVYGGN